MVLVCISLQQLLQKNCFWIYWGGIKYVFTLQLSKGFKQSLRIAWVTALLTGITRHPIWIVKSRQTIKLVFINHLSDGGCINWSKINFQAWISNWSLNSKLNESICYSYHAMRTKNLSHASVCYLSFQKRLYIQHVSWVKRHIKAYDIKIIN